MLSLMWTVLCVAPVEAAQLRLNVPTGTVSVGQTIFAELQVINGEADGLPELAASPGLRAQFTGTEQSITSINFQTTRITTYKIGVTALRAGQWTLGPASAVVGGQRLEAAAVTVNVQPRSPEQDARASVQAEISDRSPFVGEVETYHFQYRRSISTYSDELSPMSFEGFIQANEVDEGRGSYAMMENGRQVNVDDLYFPLVATTPGRHTIPASLLTARVPVEGKPSTRPSMFGRRQSSQIETFSTEAIDVVIRPLPTEGQPAGFSGLVGQYRLRTMPAEAEVSLGESVTVTVQLRGDGRLLGHELAIPPHDDLQVYTDNPEYNAAVIDGKYEASATYRLAVVPAAVGTLTLAPIPVQVFDPDAEQYVTIQTEPVRITVLPGEGGLGEVTSFSQGDQRREVTALGEDILPAPRDARIRDHRLTPMLPWLLALPGLPALGLLGLAIRPRTNRTRPSDRLRKQLASLPTEPAARLHALESVFREAAGVRLGIPGPAVTRDRIVALGADAVALDDALSRARYGRADAAADLEPQVRAFVEGT